jgi:signal transduction histidine kinase
LDLCSDPSALRSLCDLVNEAVANANRHGDATTITFLIESHDSIISIEASNDGALVELGKPGLGSRIYDSATNKNWQLSNINDRVTLIARIPIQKEEI